MFFSYILHAALQVAARGKQPLITLRKSKRRKRELHGPRPKGGQRELALLAHLQQLAGVVGGVEVVVAGAVVAVKDRRHGQSQKQ
jgi:hypothetical protein